MCSINPLIGLIDGFMGRTLRYSNVSLSSPQIDGFKVRTAHSKIHQSDRIIKANSGLFSLVPRPSALT